MERLIEGIQDCEKIWILQKKITNKKQLEKLNKIVSQFTPEGLTQKEVTQMVNEARKVLNSF